MEDNANAFEPLDMAVTADDQVHIFYDDGDGQYNVWNSASNWGSEYSPNSSDDVHSQRIAANSNDIYIVWNNESTIKLRQRDFAPLIPQNLTHSVDDPFGDKHPRIDWDESREADIDKYLVYKKKGSPSFTLYDSTTSNYYIDDAETGVSLLPFTNSVTISYTVKAQDLEKNQSGYSDTVSFHQEGGTPEKPAASGLPEADAAPDQFALFQNYPNPFNPTTTITFSLKEAGIAELTVYNLNGQRIATLVNSTLNAGVHRAEWNGRDQSGSPVSSGVYVYELKTEEQRMVKKMLLLK